MSNLAEALPAEQKRCRELAQEYRKIPQGAFGAMMIEQALERAEQAASAGDVVAMCRSLAELRECE